MDFQRFCAENAAGTAAYLIKEFNQIIVLDAVLLAAYAAIAKHGDITAAILNCHSNNSIICGLRCPRAGRAGERCGLKKPAERETGETPVRSRHCVGGVLRQKGHWASAREGGAARGSLSQETCRRLRYGEQSRATRTWLYRSANTRCISVRLALLSGRAGFALLFLRNPVLQ